MVRRENLRNLRLRVSRSETRTCHARVSDVCLISFVAVDALTGARSRSFRQYAGSMVRSQLLGSPAKQG